MIRKHPEPALLVEYATGSLPLAPTISVTTHVHFCDACRTTTDSLQEVGGQLLEATEAEAIPASLLETILSEVDSLDDLEDNEVKQQCVDEIAAGLPSNVRDLLPADLNWRSLSAGLKVAAISVGETQFELALHKIEAGGKAPEHDHGGQEITVVLSGSFSDEDGVYQPGDFIVREPGDSHRPIAAQNGDCICLSVLEAPIKLKGFKRVLNPFLSFSPS